MKQLESLVKRTNINKHDIIDAIDFLKKYKTDQKKSELMTSGPCINCGKKIKYKDVSHTQFRRGDSWLWDKIVKWKSPAKIKATSSDTAIVNGLSLNTVYFYSCDNCFMALKDEADKHLDLRSKLRRYEEEKTRAHKKKYASWCKESLESDTVHIADIFTTYMNEVVDYQSDPFDQKLPDYEDINDTYYEIVKRYKAYKENNICKYCSAENSKIILIERDFLYWNEYLHYNLDAMICICDRCYSEAKKKNNNGISFGYRFEDEY